MLDAACMSRATCHILTSSTGRLEILGCGLALKLRGEVSITVYTRRFLLITIKLVNKFIYFPLAVRRLAARRSASVVVSPIISSSRWRFRSLLALGTVLATPCVGAQLPSV